MNIAIRYFTRSGNTKKLADAIAEAISIEAKDISCSLDEKVDVLFLGCSYYAFDVDPAVKEFIANNKDLIGSIVCFGTSAMMKSMRKPLCKVADAYAVTVAGEEFHCRGRFGKLHRDRPNANDIESVKTFALSVLKNL